MTTVRILTTDDGLIPEDLLRSGLDHFRAATLLFEAGPAYFDSAGYMAHMSAELLLKAWLLQAAGQFKGIHSLRKLHHELVTSHGAAPMTTEQVQVLELLDKYGQLRYPNRADPTEVGDDDLPMITEFIRHVLSSLPVPLRQAIDQLHPVEKGGRVLMRKKNGSRVVP